MRMGGAGRAFFYFEKRRAEPRKRKRRKRKRKREKKIIITRVRAQSWQSGQKRRKSPMRYIQIDMAVRTSIRT